MDQTRPISTHQHTSGPASMRGMIPLQTLPNAQEAIASVGKKMFALDESLSHTLSSSGSSASSIETSGEFTGKIVAVYKTPQVSPNEPKGKSRSEWNPQESVYQTTLRINLSSSQASFQETLNFTVQEVFKAITKSPAFLKLACTFVEDHRDGNRKSFRFAVMKKKDANLPITKDIYLLSIEMIAENRRKIYQEQSKGQEVENIACDVYRALSPTKPATTRDWQPGMRILAAYVDQTMGLYDQGTKQ